MKMMSGLLHDDNIDKLVTTVELFINSLGSLMTVFDGYEGGDFCSGLIFGMNGAQMLAHIATAAFEMTAPPANKGAKVNATSNHKQPKAIT
jgi:hypothetical protein